MLSLSRVLSAALCLTLVAGNATAADSALRGDPLYRRYTVDDFGAKPRHYEIASGRDGRIFVANAEGVLHTDGQGWRLIPLPGNADATSVGLGRDGRIYVGGYDHFGVLSPGPRGDLIYQDLREAPAEAAANAPLGNVWQTLVTAQGIWFRGENALHFYGYGGRYRQQIPLPPDARSFYVVGDALYGRVHGVGVVRLENGRLEPLAGGEIFSAQPLAAVLPAEDGLWLVGGNGFHHYDGRDLRHRPSAADSLFAESGPYEVTLLHDHSLLVGTFAGELQRYDRKLRLLDRVPLGLFAIEGFAHDREGGLWVASETELLRLRLPGPWTRIDQAHGLRGTVLASEWHDGTLWLAGTRGIARVRAPAGERPQVEPLDWTEYEGYALLSTDAGLLVGHRDGVGVLESGNRPRPLGSTDEAVLQLLPSRYEADRVYARGATRVRQLERREGRWEQIAEWPLGNASATALIEAGPEELWLDDTRGGPQRWRLDPKLGAVLERQSFGRREGLEVDPAAGSRVHWLDGRVHVVSGNRTFVWDGGRFVPADVPPFSLVDRPVELRLADTGEGLFAFTSRRLFRRAPGRADWEPVRFDGTTTQGFESVGSGRDGIVRVSTWSGLLQYDPTVTLPASPPLRVDVVALDGRQPGGQPVRWPDSLSEGALPVMSGSYLSFQFGVVTYEPGLEYRYRVRGITDEWSDWMGSPELAVSVRPGRLIVDVEARTRSGRDVEPLSLRIEGQPRWHESLWARGLAGLAALAALGLLAQGFVQRRTARYLAANRRLEGRIAERTRELEEANRRLAEIAVEDALTGIANRRALESGLQREWLRCMENRRPLAVLMIDVDHFKRYNDLHGHLEGDVMLRRVAERLREEFDPQRELLARFGGEEFALLLPGAHLEEAQRRAERLRQCFDRPEEELSVSIGVAAQVPNAEDEPHGLLRRADAALYRAKRNGRNRVEVANE